ncbi:DUF4031 domain-containing protein [uncultured Pseudokineococcus sp.]|uniref:DUF4031 domain-containing protein n=1 Tax=uncultured Pseudokineococcus sp. TaxID=1642928 RepID=UPI0026232FAB|nr:DUF4031 domain-containing protein [uncultured Pseudokineococcus sp.]
MAVLVDPPRWPAHGREWSHLVSDVSLEELHAFARRVGIPARGFEGDHYDVPAERLEDLLAAGAVLVPAGELLRRLVASGLRVPKRRGQRVLDSWLERRTDGAAVHVDLVASSHPPPAPTTRGVRGLVLDDDRCLLLRRLAGSQDGRWALPVVVPVVGRPLGFTRHRPPADPAAGGRRAPSSSWRHLALVDAAPSEVVAGALDELRRVPVTSAAQVCGAPPWWPLVVHSLEAVVAARR